MPSPSLFSPSSSAALSLSISIGNMRGQFADHNSVANDWLVGCRSPQLNGSLTRRRCTTWPLVTFEGNCGGGGGANADHFEGDCRPSCRFLHFFLLQIHSIDPQIMVILGGGGNPGSFFLVI